MSKILIVAEHSDGRLSSSAAELVAAARAVGGEVHGALIGNGSSDAAAGFGAFGIESVHTLDGGLPYYSSDAFARALAPAVRDCGYEHIVFLHSFRGRDMAARLAAAIGAAYASDVTGIEAGPVFVKPIFAGKVISRFSFNRPGPRVLTIRPKVFTPAPAAQSVPVKTLALSMPTQTLSRVTQVQAKEQGEIDVKDADIIITGGRGVGGPEGFAPLREFAHKVGCALGASRAAVDAGWIGHSHQVGQTGKTVTPKLYIACGVSGAIQHLAGMQTSKCIVAINSSESAPLLKIADYGIVGDLFEVVPELQRQILALRAQG